MFERSLLVSQRSHASVQQRWTTVASITFQVGVAAVVIAVPLFHQEMPQLKIEAPKAFVQLKPPPKLVPVQVETHAASRAPSTPTPVQTQTVQFQASPRIPIGIDMTPDHTPPTDFTGGNGMECRRACRWDCGEVAEYLRPWLQRLRMWISRERCRREWWRGCCWLRYGRCIRRLRR